MAHPALLSYSLVVSILVEIAEKADVSVEGVVRVLTREPVSEAIKERVLDVLDDLTPEQTRAVQRFALAALHDVLPRHDDVTEAVDEVAAPDEPMPALPVSTAAEPDRLTATGSDTALVQLSSVLGELAEAVRDLRRETDAERRERVDDLAVLIDLITTGWQGLDARLGRIERQVGRLESGRREPLAVAPVRVTPVAVEAAPVEAAPVEPVEAAPVEPVPSPPLEPGKRDRLPVAAALTLVGAAVGTLAVLQLASGGPDLSRLVSARDTPSKTTDGQRSTGAASTRAAPTTAAPPSTRSEPRAAAPTTSTRPPATKPAAPVTTSGVLGTTAPGTRPRPPAATTASSTTSARPPATTRPATTAASPAGFRPTRNWAWAPVQDAGYYDVEFSRAGQSFYRATPSEARLTLPSSVVFRPGSYRWVVRPGFGERAAKKLGPPVVDSAFTVAG